MSLGDGFLDSKGSKCQSISSLRSHSLSPRWELMVGVPAKERTAETMTNNLLGLPCGDSPGST
jgi:hypothetical protein